MENTSTDKIIAIREAQKAYFHSGATKDIKFRKHMLKRLLSALEFWEERICDALWKDMHKSCKNFSVFSNNIQNFNYCSARR